MKKPFLNYVKQRIDISSNSLHKYPILLKVKIIYKIIEHVDNVANDSCTEENMFILL